MRNFLITAGILWSILLPTYAQAASTCPEEPGAYALAQLTPLGHYAQRVVTRINEGILHAQGLTGIEEEQSFLERSTRILQTISATFYLLVDTDLRSVEYSRDLETVNVCLHTDLAILGAKIEEIRCEIKEAFARRSSGGMYTLKKLAGFANQSYKHLVKGALDPEHKDIGWQYYQPFDQPFEGWCCISSEEMCRVTAADNCESTYNAFFPTVDDCTTQSTCRSVEDRTEPLRPKYSEQCPFDSDYTAPNTSGFGCDLSVLRRLGLADGDTSPAGKEIAALKNIRDTRDDYLQDIDHFRDITLTMDTFAENTVLEQQERRDLRRFGQSASSTTPHKRVWGCSADVTPEQRVTLPETTGQEQNRGTEGVLTPGVLPSQEWITNPVRGAFSFGKDHLNIWKLFLRLNHNWVLQREFPVYLKRPDEVFDEDERKEAVRWNNQSFNILEGTRNNLRNAWTDFMLKQATDESTILPKAHDMPQQVRSAMEPIRPAMKRNVELVTKPNEGLRKFTRNYAYFLRRSCIYRPCNTRLEMIMKILYTDACFPYASGKFKVRKSSSAPGPSSWQECIQGIQKL